MTHKRVHLNRPVLGFKERVAVDSVLRSGLLAQGKKVAQFERAFSKTVGGRSSIAVNSGTSALHLGMLSLGIGVGDEVLVPSFTFAATANAVVLTGARPVFIDIEPDYFSISSDAVRSAITSRTKAVVAVHLYGHPALISDLRSICDKAGIFLIEDSAQSHLAEFDGTPVGAWGDSAAFSFYPTKNMTTGEGGIVVSRNEQDERMVRLLRNQGMEVRYQNEIPGFNNRMTEISAAIGLVQLERLSGWTQARRRNAEFYNSNIRGVTLPKVHPLAKHSYHQYTILVPGHNRDRFALELSKHGIDSDIYYPVPVHLLPAYNLKLDLDVTDLVAKSCLSIPVHPKLASSELHRVADAINTIANAGA